MLAFQQGHRDAFDALYQAIWSPVCLRAARMGLRAEESEEITQKVLVRIFLYCAKAEFRSTAQIWSWVYTSWGAIYHFFDKFHNYCDPNKPDVHYTGANQVLC